MYEELSEKEGHPLSRTEMARLNRKLYKNIKLLEDEGKTMFFLESNPHCILYLRNAGRMKKVIQRIDDTPENKSKAYNQFIREAGYEDYILTKNIGK